MTTTKKDAMNRRIESHGIALLHVFPNAMERDPRGYALKIRDEWMAKHETALHRDWGGYGIIAPDLSE